MHVQRTKSAGRLSNTIEECPQQGGAGEGVQGKEQGANGEAYLE